MTAKEYLGQAYRLENRIRLQQKRIDELRELSCSVGSPGFEEHHNPNRGQEAPFVKTLLMISEYERQASKKMQKLLQLREQVRSGIDAMDNKNEALVLEHRYIYNLSWSRIGEEMEADESTVRRWHGRALAHYRVPEEPIII